MPILLACLSSYELIIYPPSLSFLSLSLSLSLFTAHQAVKRETSLSRMYDLLVAGAGIAGLHVATRYLKANSSHSVLVVERNSYLGGRIYTHHQTINKTEYQWEAGAGRIPTSHKRIIGLIKEYGLTFQKWEAPPNLHDPFPDLIPAYLEPLQSLPAAVLAENTLADVLQEIHGSVEANRFMALFPYWAEFHTLRADVALEAFLRGPLGGQGGKAGHGPASRSTAGVGWGGCAEGLSALPQKMGEDIKARGGEIRLGTSVVAISPLGEKSLNDGKGFQVLLESNGKRYTVEAKQVVLALDVSSLKHIKGPTQSLPVLRYLKQEPLLRTYAVFPVRGGKSWFSGMAKEVVPGPIRFFIPMAAEKGLAMISYTEGRDARYWMRMPESKRKKEMMRALRELYPEKEIPDPLFVKFHGWESGCTYWIPSQKGREYDAGEESEKSVEPVKGLYLCSESFAVQQSWMESALVQADRVLGRLGGGSGAEVDS